MSVSSLLRRTLIIAGSAAFCLASAAPSFAQTMPAKPYSQWTKEEDQAYSKVMIPAAGHECKDVRGLSSSDSTGAHLLNACLFAYFVLHLPKDHPKRAALTTAANAEYKAGAAGGKTPIDDMMAQLNAGG